MGEIQWFGSGYGFRIKNKTFAELVDHGGKPLMEISKEQLLAVYEELVKEEARGEF